MLSNTHLLFKAIEDNNLESVQDLCHKVKNINEVDVVGFNPLTRAVKKGNVDVIKILINEQKKHRKSTLNEIHPRYGWGVLHHAVAIGQNKTVLATLIKQGAKVDLKDGKDDTVFNYLNRSQKYEPQQKKELIDYFIKEYILASSSKPSSIQNDKKLSVQWDATEKNIQDIKNYLPETILSTKEKEGKKSISLDYDSSNLICNCLSFSDKESLWEAVKSNNLDKEKHSQYEFKKEKKQQETIPTPSLKEKIQPLFSWTQTRSRVNRITLTLFSLPNSSDKKIDDKRRNKILIK